jgi:hypothetical protein
MSEFGTWLEDDGWNAWCCVSGLRKLIDVPEAQRYWLVASTHQWNDRSGVAVKVIKYDNDPWYLPGSKRGKIRLCIAVFEKILRLAPEFPATIYVRLEYEE